MGTGLISFGLIVGHFRSVQVHISCWSSQAPTHHATADWDLVTAGAEAVKDAV